MAAAHALSVIADPPRATRRDWLGLGVIALPCMLYSMDLTVLNLALPRIAEDLRPSSAKLLWIIDIYGFFVAGLLITMGNIGDRIGRRRLLLIGAAAFGVASLVASQSHTAGMLITARALLGIAGATLAPSTLSLIRNMFLDPRQRTIAIGVWTASYSIGGAMGPVLGGLILQRFHWGSVFLLAVPVMVVLLVAGPVLLPESRDPNAKRLDLASAALSLVAVLSLIYGLKAYVQDGFGWIPAASFGASIACGAAFVRRQRGLTQPLIDLGLFKVPGFSVSVATYLLATLVTFGSYVVVGQYLQLVLGLGPLTAGLWLLPWSASYVAGSFLAPLLARRIRPARLMAGGLLCAAAGFIVAGRVAALGVGPLVIVSTLYSLALSPVFTLGIDAIVAAAPPARAGAAAALSETCSERGGALGIAVLGSIGTAVYRATLAGTAALAEAPAVARRAALDTLGGAVAAATQMPGDAAATRLVGAARVAFSHGMQVTLTLCAILSVATAIVRLRPSRARCCWRGKDNPEESS